VLFQMLLGRAVDHLLTIVPVPKGSIFKTANVRQRVQMDVWMHICNSIKWALRGVEEIARFTPVYLKATSKRPTV
jgi:hypothetical protein